MTAVEFVPFGAPARAALRDAIADARAGDPMAPVTVAVPSNYAGLSLRRTLARDGLVNVRFAVLDRAAELLGAPALAAEGRSPLTPALRAEALRCALDAGPGPFAGVAGHPATERALDATFRDLRDLDDAGLDRLAAQGPRAAAVVALYHAYRAQTSGYYDPADIADAAARAVAAGHPALVDLGRLVVYLPRRLSPAQVRFVRALGDRGLATVILGLTGDRDCDALTASLASQLTGTPAAIPDVAKPHATGVVVAPDIEEEVRTAVRGLLVALERGESAGRCAILFPSAENYAGVVHEQLRAAGIPFNGPARRRLADTVAGRHLLRLLALREDGLRRDDVMAWLAAAPVRGKDGRTVPAARWDALSREAAVVGGLDQWQSRLEHFVNDLEAKADAAEEDGQSWLAERNRRDAGFARDLAALVTDLDSTLDPGARATWSEFAGWARDLQRAYLGPASRVDFDDPSEREAAEAVESALEGLAALDALGRIADLSLFRRTLEQVLDVPAGREGAFGAGVFVAEISAAGGLEFDRLFLLGMVEGQFPARPREDPLLPDAIRAALGDALPPRDRVLDQHRDYLAVLAGAREAVLSYPQADLRGQRKNMPSRWLLDTASALEGERILTAGFARLKPNQWLARVPSFEWALGHAGALATAQELRLRRLSRPEGDPLRAAVLGDPRLVAGLEAGRLRGGEELSRWDGYIGPRPELAPGAVRPASPTTLEQWARCPMQYFLRHVLRVSEFTRPEDALTLSPRDRGSLIHEVLQRFFEAMRERPDPLAPWSDAERELLSDLTGEVCDRAHEAGLSGKPLLWDVERRRLARDLDLFLDAELQVRAESGYAFAAAELAFGTNEANAYPAAVVTLGDGRAVAFRGRVDRVDEAPGPRLAVYDYKSGSATSYKKLAQTTVDEGLHLQLPIYALAARAALGTSETPVEAHYWFVDEREEFKRYGYSYTPEHDARFRDAIGYLLDGIGGGVFPANPGDNREKGYGNCNYCAYRDLCQSERARQWEKKQHAPEAAPYRALHGEEARDA